MPLTEPFELILFHTNAEFDTSAIQAGIQTIIVDWEQRGKEQRQRNFDTQINLHTADDLRIARSIKNTRLICRLNGWGPWTAEEVELAIGLGVDELLLPMVRSVKEVEDTLTVIAGRCGFGIMLETPQALELAASLAQFPLARVYMGLNDLSILRQDRHLFAPVADGTVQRFREAFARLSFGFGGLTLPDRGYPLTCQLLINEMARLDCNFSFLRRSFVRDIRGYDLNIGVQKIKAALTEAHNRTVAQVQADQAELLAAIMQLPDKPWKLD
jgi:hypothetical protein